MEGVNLFRGGPGYARLDPPRGCYLKPILSIKEAAIRQLLFLQDPHQLAALYDVELPGICSNGELRDELFGDELAQSRLITVQVRVGTGMLADADGTWTTTT